MAEQGERGRKWSVMDLSTRDQEDLEALAYRRTSLGRSPPARSVEKKARVLMSAAREVVERQTACIMGEVQELINKSFGTGEEEVFLLDDQEGAKGADEDRGSATGGTDGGTNPEHSEASEAGGGGTGDTGAEDAGLEEDEEARNRELARRGRREMERLFRSKRGEDMEDEINRRVEERMQERVGKDYRERMELIKGALGSIYKATNNFSKGRLNFNLSSLAEVGNATGVINTEIIALMVEMTEMRAYLRVERERNEWLKRELNERERERLERLSTREELLEIRGEVTKLEKKMSERPGREVTQQLVTEGDRRGVTVSGIEGRKAGSGSSGTRVREEERGGRERELRVDRDVEGKQGGEKETKEESLWSKVVGRKTFVEASVWKAQQEERRRKMEEKSKVWASPVKQQPGLEIVVVDVREEKRNEQGSRELLKELKLKLLQGGIRELKVVRATKTGGVVIIGHTPDQIELVKEVVKGRENWATKGEQTNPRLKIISVEKGKSDEEIVEGIWEENTEIRAAAGTLGKDSIKVITRREVRRPYHENIMVEMSPEVFRAVIKKGKINLDLVTKFVQEYVDLTMCYRCCRFGHPAKYCREKAECYRCGGDHEGKECKVKEEWDCLNCKRVGIAKKDRKHMARDGGCPVFGSRLESVGTNTRYTSQDVCMES